MTVCDRCGQETTCTTMSYFNVDIICNDCDDLERKHPNFGKAMEVEANEVRQGNYNYEGIGLPEDYQEWTKSI